LGKGAKELLLGTRISTLIFQVRSRSSSTDDSPVTSEDEDRDIWECSLPRIMKDEGLYSRGWIARIDIYIISQPQMTSLLGEDFTIEGPKRGSGISNSVFVLCSLS